MLKLQVFPDHEQASQFAADWLVERLRNTPNALVCVAAGTTPMRAYALFAERAVLEPSLVDRCRIVKLDEWGGLPTNHPATCEQHLKTLLITPLGLAERYVGFGSQPESAEDECARVAKWLTENGPIEVCVLGLGLNGHLGFNEPASNLQPHAHVAQLSDVSLSHSMISRCDTRPAYGLTLGMADLVQSRQILLLVTGKEKRAPLERLLSGQISTQFPASLLQLHRDLCIVCDHAAISDR